MKYYITTSQSELPNVLNALEHGLSTGVTFFKVKTTTTDKKQFFHLDVEIYLEPTELLKQIIDCYHFEGLSVRDLVIMDEKERQYIVETK